MAALDLNLPLVCAGGIGGEEALGRALDAGFAGAQARKESKVWPLIYMQRAERLVPKPYARNQQP